MINGLFSTLETLWEIMDRPCWDCRGELAFTFKDVGEVLHGYVEDRIDYADTGSCAVVKLKSGEYGVFWEWSDSSGHG